MSVVSGVVQRVWMGWIGLAFGAWKKKRIRYAGF